MKTIKAILFWVVSWTWGLPMTLIGAIIALCLLTTGHKPYRFHYFIYFEVGENWGGLECGCFFIMSRGGSLHIKQHESGHGIQNVILGWFMPFVVCIPSAVRYWYRKHLVRTGRKKSYELPDYDSMWFEGWATHLGKKYFAEV